MHLELVSSQGLKAGGGLANVGKYPARWSRVVWKQSDFHNQSPSSSNTPHKLHNFLCMCNLSIHKIWSKKHDGAIFFRSYEIICECKTLRCVVDRCKDIAMQLLSGSEWLLGYWPVIDWRFNNLKLKN